MGTVSLVKIFAWLRHELAYYKFICFFSTGVKPTRTTSTSCTVSWIPSNTNFMHSICVNNVEVKIVKPGVFRHTLAGLQPNTSYKVTIRAKNLKAAPHITGM